MAVSASTNQVIKYEPKTPSVETACDLGIQNKIETV